MDKTLMIPVCLVEMLYTYKQKQISFSFFEIYFIAYTQLLRIVNVYFLQSFLDSTKDFFCYRLSQKQWKYLLTCSHFI